MRQTVERSRRGVEARVALVLGIVVLLALPACAQRPVLKTGFETEGAQVRAVFAPVVAAARRSTVRLNPAVGGPPVALGLVVSDTGAVLTKASELLDADGMLRAVAATLSNGHRVPLELVGTDVRSDLALMRMTQAVEGLVAFDLVTGNTAAVPVPGSWVAVPGLDAAPDAVGVVSAGPRGLAPVRLGVTFFRDRAWGAGDTSGPLVVSAVQDNMGAARAGVRPGDRMLRLGDRELLETQDLVEPLRDARVGDTVELVVQRGNERLALPITLMNRPVNLKDRTDFMNQMGNTLSRRRDGFDAVFQHDATIEPEQCGGPLVDLDGRLIGINIARAGRVESYALPVAEVVAALARLRGQE